MTLYVNGVDYKRICCVIGANGKLKRRIYISDDGTVKYMDYDVDGKPIFDREYDILLGFENG